MGNSRKCVPWKSSCSCLHGGSVLMNCLLRFIALCAHCPSSWHPGVRTVMAPHCPPPNLWNLWMCWVIWQRGKFSEHLDGPYKRTVEGKEVLEWCNMRKNSIAFAGFDNGGRSSQAKEWGRFLEAGKIRAWILTRDSNKECNPGITLILTQRYPWQPSDF